MTGIICGLMRHKYISFLSSDVEKRGCIAFKMGLFEFQKANVATTASESAFKASIHQCDLCELPYKLECVENFINAIAMVASEQNYNCKWKKKSGHNALHCGSFAFFHLLICRYCCFFFHHKKREIFFVQCKKNNEHESFSL